MGSELLVEKSRNFHEWQGFVDNSAMANIFQTAHFAKAIEEAGLKSLLVVARDTRGNIRGGMLSTYRQYSFLKLNIIPTITVTGGPLVDNVNDVQLLHDVLGFFDTKAKNLGAFQSSVRSFFPLDNVLVGQFNYRLGRLPCTVIFDLSRPTEQLWKDMEKNARYGIRKAEKAGVVVQEATHFEDLSAYYRIQESTSGRLEIPLVSFRVLESLWKNFFSKGVLKLFLAKYNAQPIAGDIVLRWRDKMWACYTASLRPYWHLNPNLLLWWHTIKWGRENSLRIFDFMGIPCSDDRTHPLYALYLFKKQFRGQIVRHGEYIKNQSQRKSILFERVLKVAHPMISSFRKRQHQTEKERSKLRDH